MPTRVGLSAFHASTAAVATRVIVTPVFITCVPSRTLAHGLVPSKRRAPILTPHCLAVMATVEIRDEDGYVRITDKLKAMGYRDFANLQQKKLFKDALTNAMSETHLTANELVKTKRGRRAGTFVHPSLSRHLNDAFNAQRSGPMAPPQPEAKESLNSPGPATQLQMRIDDMTSAWTIEQRRDLIFLFKRKALLDEFKLSDAASDDAFRDATRNAKRRIIEGPSIAEFVRHIGAPPGAVNATAPDHITAVTAPDEHKMATDPPVPTVESLSVTEVLLRFRGIQLTGGQCLVIGLLVKQAYEGKHRSVPGTVPTRVNGHVVDKCVYQRSDWHLVFEALDAYNADLERAGKPKIVATHAPIQIID